MATEYARFRLDGVGEFTALSSLIRRRIETADREVRVLVDDPTGFVASFGAVVRRRTRQRPALALRILVKLDRFGSRDETQRLRDRRVHEYFEEVGWQVRATLARNASSCLLIDDVAFVEDLVSGKFDVLITEIEDAAIVSDLTTYFEQLWVGPTTLIYEDEELGFATDDPTIAVIADETWSSLVARLVASPELMRDLPPRKFEELIAHLLARDGYDVHLTERSRDGGRDILVRANSMVGSHLYYVECKRYSAVNKVGVEIVRSLYGVVAADNATAGLLVTTSSFTDGALRFARQVENRVSLRAFNDVVRWVRSAR